jgi:hypothetical protein
VKALKWIFLLAGIALFAVSFKLPAIREVAKPGATAGTLSGYDCAVLALLQPWGKEGLILLRSDPVNYVSVLLSGWINPFFVIAILALLIRPAASVYAVLRVVLPLMFVFCWIVFYKIHYWAYVGYWVWMAGILLALFSDLWVKRQITGKIAGDS